jgi:glucokinase
MTILVDIGGTYARFALLEKNAPQHVRKYSAQDFENFEAALAAYQKEVGSTSKTLRISTAAHPDKGIWRFVNRNQWVMDEAALKKSGFDVQIILNDFEAATWGLIDIGASGSVSVLKEKQSIKNLPSCLIGPGTGLGLGYLVTLKSGHHVQKTMGGHLAAAAVTAEQELILKSIARIKSRSGITVYEDLVSGPGLYNIYRAICELDGKPAAAQSVEAMLEYIEEPQVRTAIKLFHEFFALFAASVCVAGNSYGGLYLMGGVIDRLAEKNLFDFAHFEKFFVADVVPSIHKMLDATPVFHVTDPYLALKGLIAAHD